jgi:DtxR family Mn-dependent transcriptional regulator
VSPAFESRLVQKLGHKDLCPHGNGMALRSDSERRKHGLCLLSEAEQGKKYRVHSVYERDRKLLEFFDQEGVRPGTSVNVRSQNYDGTVTLAIGSHTIRLGLPAANKVWVAKN